MMLKRVAGRRRIRRIKLQRFGAGKEGISWKKRVLARRSAGGERDNETKIDCFHGDLPKVTPSWADL